MAFKFKSTIGGVGRKLERVLLGSSATFVVGEAVETYSTGVAVHALAAKPLLGVIAALCDSQGQPLQTPAIAAGTASGSSVTSVTTGAGNTQYYALVDISEDTVYSVDVTGTLGTTASSTLRGCKIDIDSAKGKVLESTATRTIATTANFVSLGTDPSDAARLMVVIGSSELRNSATTEV